MSLRPSLSLVYGVRIPAAAVDMCRAMAFATGAGEDPAAFLVRSIPGLEEAPNLAAAFDGARWRLAFDADHRRAAFLQHHHPRASGGDRAHDRDREHGEAQDADRGTSDHPASLGGAGDTPGGQAARRSPRRSVATRSPSPTVSSSPIKVRSGSADNVVLPVPESRMTSVLGPTLAGAR